MGSYEAMIAGLAIFLGMLVVLIPITGLTARFALKPVMEALGKYRESQGDQQMQQLLERRVALMEEQMHSMDRSLRELAEESEFRRELETGKAQRAALPLPTAEPQPVVARAEAQPHPVTAHADPLSHSA
jgi:uncharacterized protein (DUF2164 family)